MRVYYHDKILFHEQKILIIKKSLFLKTDVCNLGKNKIILAGFLIDLTVFLR